MKFEGKPQEISRKSDGKIRKEPPYKIQRKLSGNSKESRFITYGSRNPFRMDSQSSEQISNFQSGFGIYSNK